MTALDIRIFSSDSKKGKIRFCAFNMSFKFNESHYHLLDLIYFPHIYLVTLFR